MSLTLASIMVATRTTTEEPYTEASVALPFMQLVDHHACIHAK
jgi:hypothetical protein